MHKSAARLILLVAIVAATVQGQPPGRDETTRDKAAEWRRLTKELKSEQTPIEFYGRVLDLDGEPVSGAVVSAGIPRTVVDKLNLRLRTDDTGRFEIRPSRFRKGIRLHIYGIEKSGYEFRGPDNPDCAFEFRRDSGMRHHPDPVNPVVFRLRKMRENPTFLVEHRLTFSLNAERQSVSYNLLTGQRADIRPAYPSRVGGQPVPECEDIVARAVRLPEKALWQLTLSVPYEDGGIVASDELLTDAPTDGYGQELVLFVDPSEHAYQGPKYLYIKVRTPALYARIEFPLKCTPEFVRSFATVRIDPYGERNLEMRPDIPGGLKLQLEKEALAAWERGELPQVPDLGALIAEFEKTQKHKRR